jgi:hypothetical protein
MGGSHLTVLVPGLSQAMQACQTLANYPLLRKLISRGSSNALQSDSFESTAFSMFNFQQSGSEGLPIAAVSYYGIADQRPKGWCLRVDPAHLEPRLTKLYLIAGKQLAVTKDEANSLIAVIQELYEEYGWRVHALNPDQWYLVLPDDPGVITTPIASVVGKDIDALLPVGTHASLWHKRMNEIQMAFHACPLNTNREVEERYTINTIWPWGSGELPELIEPVWQRVWSDEALTRGLAKLSNSRLNSAPKDASGIIDELSAGSDLLVLGDTWSVIDRSEPAYACAQLSDLEERWWRPLWAALKARALNSLTITDFDLGAVTIQDQDVRKWSRWMRFLTSDK